MKVLSIIIPLYNEQNRIARTLVDIDNTMSQQAFDYEVLAVNDGSLDDTVLVVANLQKNMPKVRLVNNTENHGKGWAIRQGMLEARGDICLFMDADNSTRVEDFFQMLPFFDNGFDVVIGSRRLPDSNITVRQELVRDFLGSVWRAIVRMLVPLSVEDSQCGFKAFTKKAAMTVFPQQTIYRWAFDVEILAIARKNALRIKEVPVMWRNDTESRLTFPDMLRSLLDLIRIRLNIFI